jgi:hypothetical protein
MNGDQKEEGSEDENTKKYADGAVYTGDLVKGIR